VMDRARVHLNDKDGQIFNDIALLPILQSAYDELAEMYEENSLPTTNKKSGTLVILQGMVDIGNGTGPALPLDLIEVQGVFERTFGSSENFIPVTKMDFLPRFNTLSSQLLYYTWQGQAIRFNGANTDREVQLDYIANTFNPIISPSSVINILNCKTALAYRTAGIAAMDIGENPTRSADLNSSASMAADRLINIATKGQQGIVTRRRPFRAGYKSRSL